MTPAPSPPRSDPRDGARAAVTGTAASRASGARPSPETLRTIARLARLLERACADATDVTLPQYRLLALVGDGSERASRIAETLTVAKPTVSAMVDALVERGLIARAEVQDDRRAVRLTLTAPGEAALVAAEQAMTARLTPVMEHCVDADDVETGWTRVATALDEMRAEREATR